MPTLGQNGDQIAHNLVRAYAAKPGGLALLLRAALAENPDNPALQGVAADFAGRAFDVLPLPKELTAHGDTISATIGENVRNVLVGKNANQVIIEGGVTITGGDFIGRDQINYFISGDPPPLYVDVPALPQHFLGRDDLLDELVKRLCAGQTTALSADGLPGVGKTTLAVALARHPDVLAHFADGVLWAGLGRSPDVASIQATWAEHLKAQITDIADPATHMDRINAAIGQRRLLIVLDDAWQAEPLDFLRTTGPNVVQILTTRDRAIARKFAGANQEVNVPVLAEAPSHALLRALAPEAWAANPAAAAALTDQVGGLPLALELLGGYLAEPERSLFPELSEAAFAELADPATRLALAQVRLGSVSGERQTLAGTIALSLDELADIRPDAVVAFYALGAFAPMPARFDLEAAKAVTGADAATLALLIARSLILQDSDQALILHQAISDYARQFTNQKSYADHLDFYINAMENGARHDLTGAYEQIRESWDLHIAFVRSDDKLETFFSSSVRQYQEFQGLWWDRKRWYEYVLFQSDSQFSSQNRAAALYNLTGVHWDIGEWEKAKSIFMDVLNLDLASGDAASIAGTLNNIGLVSSALGDKQQALDFFNQALPLRRQVGDIGSQASVLSNIGLVYNDLGDKQQALDFYNQALPLLRQVGDLSGQATTLNNIGLVYSALGDKQQALELYNQALPLQRQVGDLSGQATTLSNIGAVYSALGDKQQALDFFNQALPLGRQVGDRFGEVITRWWLGLLYAEEGDLGQAEEHLRIALEIAKAVQSPHAQAVEQALMQLQAQQQGVPSHEDSSDEGLTRDQLLDLVVQARQGDRQLGAQLYKDMQAIAADASQPAELRAPAGALVRVLVGDNHPDLTGLSSEDRAAVLALLARL